MPPARVVQVPVHERGRPADAGPVKFMHAGAIGTAADLIVLLAFSWDISLYHLTVLGHRYTTTQLIQLRPLLITVPVAFGWP